jgi:hypothetical protein
MAIEYTYQTTVKYSNIFHFPSPPKFTQIGMFGMKKLPSGNPDLEAKNGRQQLWGKRVARTHPSSC